MSLSVEAFNLKKLVELYNRVVEAKKDKI